MSTRTFQRLQAGTQGMYYYRGDSLVGRAEIVSGGGNTALRLRLLTVEGQPNWIHHYEVDQEISVSNEAHFRADNPLYETFSEEYDDNMPF